MAQQAAGRPRPRHDCERRGQYPPYAWICPVHGRLPTLWLAGARSSSRQPGLGLPRQQGYGRRRPSSHSRRASRPLQNSSRCPRPAPAAIAGTGTHALGGPHGWSIKLKSSFPEAPGPGRAGAGSPLSAMCAVPPSARPQPGRSQGAGPRQRAPPTHLRPQALRSGVLHSALPTGPHTLSNNTGRHVH